MIVAKKGPDIDNNRISDMPLIDTIEKGAQAELLMVDGNPLEKVALFNDPETYLC